MTSPLQTLKREVINKLTAIITDLAIRQAELKEENKRAYFDNSGITYYGKGIAINIQARLLRKKLDYTEDEWISLIKGFKDCIDETSVFKNYYFPLYYSK